MKDKTLLWILGGLTFAGLGYFLFVKLNKEAKALDTSGVDSVSLDSVLPEAPELATPPIAAPSAPSINPLATIFNTVNTLLSNWNDYKVVTKKDPLSVRQRPDSVSKIISSLPKGSTIKAKASGVKGWMAVSQDGKNTLGYVAQQYLTLAK